MCHNLASMSYPFNYYSGLNSAFKTAYRCLVVKIRSSKVGQLATIYVMQYRLPHREPAQTWNNSTCYAGNDFRTSERLLDRQKP